MGDNLVPIGLSQGLQGSFLSGIGSKSAILIEEADGAKAARFSPGIHSIGHYRSARAFAVNPARLKARPLRARGLTAQRGRARGLSCQECQKSPLLIRTADIGDNLGAERVVERLQGPLLELDVAEIVVHEADEPNAVVDLLNAERLTGEHG